MHSSSVNTAKGLKRSSSGNKGTIHDRCRNSFIPDWDDREVARPDSHRGSDGASPTLTLYDIRVRVVSHRVDNVLIVSAHYLHCLPGVTMFSFGVFAGHRMLGVLNIGVGPKNGHRFIARSMGYEANLEDTIRIRIRHYDKTIIAMQQADISPIRTDAVLVLHASSAPLEAVFGVLYGSI